EDPLRGLRVAQLAARLEMTPDQELVALCRSLDLSELSGERVFDEFEKLLLRAAKPAIGFRVLEDTGQLRFFPELDTLRGVPQDPEWHPEGDVWVHTLMVLDVAASLRVGAVVPGAHGPDRTAPSRTAAVAASDAGDRGLHGTTPSAKGAGRLAGNDDEDLALMLGALCHDLGKPATTERVDGRIRSYRHDVEGVASTRALLERMRTPGALVDKVATLVEHHLAPALFIRNGTTAKGYRRLARKLERAGLSMELLVRVARADHLGRTTADAVAGRFDAGDAFLAAARAHSVEHIAPRDAVLGRHLIERGMQPGPGFAPILERCREIQDETGWTDPERILDRALADR
ncbi:MAG: HD domain-containing protein, partial [Gammaproteobacteria bacterium]|nr:HD domain-containing protein [Gammaproteobacteria bacterium]